MSTIRSRKLRTNLFRILTSALISAVVTLVVQIILGHAFGVDSDDPAQLLVISYMVAWPMNVTIYIAWSCRVYSHRGSASLKQAAADDDADDRLPIARLLGVSGATNTTIAAALVAVVVTVIVAQQPQIRNEPIFIVMTLVTVASSWAQMVFSFAQSYMRLGAGGREGAHFLFHFRDPARFSDYLNFALMLSASAATVSAEATSRAAWQIVRTNVIIAFIFNSVIVAMMVSLLFGGLLG